MSPRGVDSLASSLVAREGRSLAGAGDLRRSLDGRCLRPGPTPSLECASPGPPPTPAAAGRRGCGVLLRLVTHSQTTSEPLPKGDHGPGGHSSGWLAGLRLALLGGGLPLSSEPRASAPAPAGRGAATGVCHTPVARRESPCGACLGQGPGFYTRRRPRSRCRSPCRTW